MNILKRFWNWFNGKVEETPQEEFPQEEIKEAILPTELFPKITDQWQVSKIVRSVTEIQELIRNEKLHPEDIDNLLPEGLDPKVFNLWKKADRLIQEMISKQIIPNDKDTISNQMIEVMSWNDEIFESMEKVVEQFPGVLVSQRPTPSIVEQLEQCFIFSHIPETLMADPHTARIMHHKEAMTKLLVAGQKAGILQHTPTPSDESIFIKEQMGKAFNDAECLDCTDNVKQITKAIKSSIKVKITSDKKKPTKNKKKVKTKKAAKASSKNKGKR